MPRLSPSQQGIAALLLVTAVWGTTFPAMKALSAHFDAMQLIFLRFAIAGAVLAPCAIDMRRTEWRWGLALGFVLFIAFTLQIEGLVRTSANRNAFVSSLNVLLVPILGWALGQRPAWNVWAACGLAVLGVRCLFWSDAPWNWGDTLTLASTVFYASYLQMISWMQAKNTALAPRALRLAAVQAWVMLVLGAAMLLASGRDLGVASAQYLPSDALWMLIYLGTAASIGCIALQAWGQRYVAATPSAVIYGTEPLFAATAGLYLLGERFTFWGYVGAALLVAALILSQIEFKKHA